MKCTCCKSQYDADPTQDIRPWEFPVDVAFAEEVDGHAGVDRQSQERQKSCRNHHKPDHKNHCDTHWTSRCWADHYLTDVSVDQAEICSKCTKCF